MIWKDIKIQKPLAYKRGAWDGLKSDKILVCTLYDRYYIATMYEGIIDGEEFCDFYNNQDCEIIGVRYWTEIDSPF